MFCRISDKEVQELSKVELTVFLIEVNNEGDGSH